VTSSIAPSLAVVSKNKGDFNGRKVLEAGAVSEKKVLKEDFSGVLWYVPWR